MHFLAFCLNTFIWGFVGFLIAKKINKIFHKNKKEAQKNTAIAIISAVFGGLFGFLLNGLPSSTLSINDFLYSFIFSLVGILINNREINKTLSFNPKLKLPVFFPRKRTAK